MNYSPPSLQQLCVRSVIQTNGLLNVLDPYINDWDAEEFPRNDCLTRDEEIFFQQLAVTGQLLMTGCKDALRSMLYRRPCNLDLVQLRTLPFCKDITDFFLRVIWADTVILEWERLVPSQLECSLGYEQLTMTWTIHNKLLDGCANVWLFASLKRERRRLIRKDREEERLAQERRDLVIWKETVGREWIFDMRYIINYACVLFL